jgi:hypothetical protein
MWTGADFMTSMAERNTHNADVGVIHRFWRKARLLS